MEQQGARLVLKVYKNWLLLIIIIVFCLFVMLCYPVFASIIKWLSEITECMLYYYPSLGYMATQWQPNWHPNTWLSRRIGYQQHSWSWPMDANSRWRGTHAQWEHRACSRARERNYCWLRWWCCLPEAALGGGRLQAGICIYTHIDIQYTYVCFKCIRS